MSDALGDRDRVHGLWPAAFDEVAAITPDASSDAPGASCRSFPFDQESEELTAFLNGGSLEIIGGQVRFSIPGTLDQDVGLQRTAVGSFVGRTTTVQVVSPSPTQSVSSTFGWHEQTGDRTSVHLEMDGFNLKLHQYNPTLDEYLEFVTIPYDPVEQAWWRLRADAVDIIAEVSRDGAVWNSFGTVSGRDLSSMTWDIALGSYAGNVAPSETTMDNASDCDP